MADAKRYELVQLGKINYLVSNSSALILRALRQANYLSYDQLSSLSGVPVDSLYVFCQRLESASLIKREKKLLGRPKRIRTVISMNATVKSLDLTILR